jgi:hypothetical protein
MTINTSREAVERAARGAWMAHQQTAADTLRALVRERDEALAREAAVVKSLVNIQEDATDTPTYGDAKAALNRIVRECEDVLSAPAAAAEARDAALVARGRREGIEEMVAALQKAVSLKEDGEEKDRLLGWIERFRALATPPADGGPR